MSKLLTLLFTTFFFMAVTSCKTTEDSTWLVQSSLSEQDVETLHSLIRKYARKSPAIVSNDTLLATDLGINEDDRSEIVFALERYKDQELYDYSLQPITVGNLLDVIETLQLLKDTNDG